MYEGHKMKQASHPKTVRIVDPLDRKLQRLHHILTLTRRAIGEHCKNTVLATLEDSLKNAGVKYVVFGANYRPDKIDDFIDITEVPTENPRVLLWIYSCTYGPEREEIVAICHMELSHKPLCCTIQ